MPSLPSSEHLAALRLAVLAAFEGVKRPPDGEIAPHECEECAAVCAAFGGVDWRAVPTAVLVEHHGVLPLLSPEAYAYFLGAWLLYAVDHFPNRDGPTDYLIYDLAPNVPNANEDDKREWERQRLRHLTDDQLAVCARFLDTVEAEPEFSRYFGDLTEGRAYYRESWEHRSQPNSDVRPPVRRTPVIELILRYRRVPVARLSVEVPSKPRFDSGRHSPLVEFRVSHIETLPAYREIQPELKAADEAIRVLGRGAELTEEVRARAQRVIAAVDRLRESMDLVDVDDRQIEGKVTLIAELSVGELSWPAVAIAVSPSSLGAR